MRLVGLYLRSRLAMHAAAILSGVALVTLVIAPWTLSRPLVSPGLVPILVFAPLVSACTLGVSTRNPFGDCEHTVSRSLSLLRLGHLVGLLAWAALALILVSFPWDDAARLLVRNLAGLTGLAFVAARLLGGRLSWTLPVAFAAIAPFAGRDGPSGGLSWWAWINQPAAHLPSLLIALALLVVGLAAICPSGPRRAADVAE